MGRVHENHSLCIHKQNLIFNFQSLQPSTQSIDEPSPMVTMIVPVGIPSTRKTLKYIRLVPLMKMTSIQSTTVWRTQKWSDKSILCDCHMRYEPQLENSSREVFYWNMTWLDVHHKSILNFEDLLILSSSHNNQDAIGLWDEREETD